MVQPLVLAVAQPVCVPGDVAANAAAHAALIREAGARVVVFPELSLTGYDLAAASLGPDDGVLGCVVEACARTDTVAFVGAPVRVEDGTSIATLAVTGDGVAVAYRKMFLHGDELSAFVPGPAPAVWEVDGWRIGLAICRDTGVVEHADATAALGIDVYVAGVVHHPHELAEQDARGDRIARRTGVPVAFASAAGAVGPDYPSTAGRSTIWRADAHVVARASGASGGFAVAALAP